MRACEGRGIGVESETSFQNELVAGLSPRGQTALVVVAGCIERSCVSVRRAARTCVYVILDERLLHVQFTVCVCR